MRYLTGAEKLFILITSPCFFFLAYDAIFYWAWIYILDYSYTTVIMMVFFTSLNFLIFMFFSHKLLKRSKVASFSGVAKNGSLQVIALSMLSFLLVLFYLGGDVSGNLSEVYIENASKSAAPVLLNTVIIYAILFGIYTCRVNFLAHISALTCILFSSLIGGRSVILMWLIFYCFALLKRYTLSNKHVFLALLTLVVFFVGSSFSRGTISVNDSSFDLELLDYNQVFTLEETISYTDRSGPRLDLYFSDVVEGFIPRALMPQKQTSTAFTREVFPWVWELTSYTSGFYASAIFALGYLGLILIPIFSVLISVIHYNFISGKYTLRSGFVVMCLTCCPVLIVRGGLFELRLIMTLFTIYVGTVVFSAITRNFYLKVK